MIRVFLTLGVLLLAWGSDIDKAGVVAPDQGPSDQVEKPKDGKDPKESSATSPGGDRGGPPVRAGADDGGPGPGAMGEGQSVRLEAQAGKAYQKAARLGEQFKKSLDSAEELPGGLPGQGGKAAAASRIDPANPTSAQELALSAIAGFGGSFDALGLKVGRDPSGASAVLRRDESPASSDELQALNARIADEPTALMRRPDFYSVLPRERFFQLKDDFRSRADLQDTAFQHITMSATQRDFERSASCLRMSGGCNPYTQQLSYRKGEQVPPEDLWKISKALHPEDDADDEREDDVPEETAGAAARKPPPAAAGLGKAGFKAIYARINGIIGAIRQFMGGADSPGAVSAGNASARGGAPRKEVSLSEAKTLKAFAGPPPGAQAPGARAFLPGPSRRPLVWLLAALAAAALAVAYSRRNP